MLFKYTEFVLLHYSTCRKLLVCNPSSQAPKNTNWIGHQNFPKKKRIKWIYWWMPQNVWRGINSNPSQSLPKFFPTYFMRPVTFEQTKVLQENKTTGSLRNVNSKLLNKICANQIQPDIQRIMYHNQLISSTRMLWQTRLNNAIYCIYRMKDKIQNPLMIQNSPQIKYRRKYLNIRRPFMTNPLTSHSVMKSWQLFL